MPVEILMPELGESVHEGTVSRWLKKVGDFVKEDEPVVEIMTDKVNTELGSPASGILTEILIPEGGQVEVFKAMGLIDAANGAAAVKTPEPVESKQPETIQEPISTKEQAPTTPSVQENGSDGRKWFSPLVRSIAQKSGLSDAELLNVAGTGTGNRVTKADIEAYLASKSKEGKPALSAALAEKPKAQPAPSEGQEIVPLAGMRKMIAEAMVRSSQVPTVTTVTQCDVTAMVKFRETNKESFQQQFGVKLTFTPFFIKALAESLAEFPLMNASLNAESQIVKNKGIHIGVAVALGAKGEDGLIVPVIRDCQSKSLVDLARDLDSIAKAARSNSLKPADVQGGTFTLTNPGTYGALFGTPMINAPQAGILGTYSIAKTPVIVDDMIAIRSIMHLVLTYDHRIIDGLLAGKFLASLRDRLQSFDFFK